MAEETSSAYLVDITRHGDNGRHYVVRAHNDVEVGMIYAEVDGFYVFWPDKSRQGYWSSWLMKSIAEHLDSLNEPLEKELEEFFSCPT